MPKKIHDKVRELLDSKTFYPEKSEKEREDLAWPIATNIIKKSSFNLRRFVFAQADDYYKSTSIDDFADKFVKSSAPGLVSSQAFIAYLTRNPTYNGKKLLGYPAFRLLLNHFNQNSGVRFEAEQIKQFLNTKNREDAENFVFQEESDAQTNAAEKPNAQNTKQPAKDEVLSQLPGAQKSSIPGVAGLQNVIQYTSQSAAKAPKTEEQKAASERMFMMDNSDALRILSRNIYDVNALRNFEKDLTFSKNHIGTRFEGPVNSLLSKYGELASTPDSDRKTKNKLGAEIQYIIQNQLLGSGVRPSVVFNAFTNPNSRTDYLFSGSKPPTPYQFRYVEDVYFDMKDELTKKFNEDRKAFAEDYVKKLKERFPDAKETPETLSEAVYPDELKLVAKPGSPIHQRAWMEQNQKSVLQKAFGAEPISNDVETPVGKLVPGPSLNTQLKAPQAPDPRSFDKSDLSGMAGKPKIDTNNLSGILGRPTITNPNPTKTPTFNLKNSTPPEQS